MSLGGVSAVTHYEERLERDLNEIRAKVKAVGDLIEDQVREAVQALLAMDADLANHVILKDRIVNRETRVMDGLSHRFVVRHLPVAGHLRYASAVQRVAVEMERVGDYAVTICRHSLRCKTPPPERISKGLELLGRQAQFSLAEALRAFHDQDEGRARKALGLTAPLDTTHDSAFEDLVALGESRNEPIRDLFAYLRSLYVLLRVSDQAENIAHDALFSATGETKNPKVYRILFVDRANDCRSQLAEAYARRAYGDAGQFTSAGWDPADSLRPELEPFLEGHGLNVEDRIPKRVPDLLREPKHYHVVIGLDEQALEMIGELPYKTVFLNWDLGPCPFSEEDPDAEKTFEAMYRVIAGQMRDLMEVLRGPDAP
jgi:phosphate transport system protein